MATYTQQVRETASFVDREPRSVWGFAPIRETAEANDLVSYVQLSLLREVAQLSTNADGTTAWLLKEVGQLNDLTFVGVARSFTARDRFFIDDELVPKNRIAFIATESAALSDNADSDVSIILSERAVIGESLYPLTDHRVLLKETAALSSYAGTIRSVLVSEQAAVADSVSFFSISQNVIRDVAAVEDSFTFVNTHQVLARASAKIQDWVSARNIAQYVDRETGYLDTYAQSVVLRSPAPGEPRAVVMEGTAYTCSVAAWAMSKLTEFPFLTMAGDKVAGANLWTLGNQTDNGLAINSNIKTGVMDLGNSRLKRLSAMYFGGTSSAPLDVAVTADVNGTKQTYNYALSLRDQTDYRNNKVLLGKGFRSRYIQMNISASNVSYNLLSVELDLANTVRRF